MRDYSEFWPVYLAAHSKPRTRALHFAGTLLAGCLLAAGACLGCWRWALAAVILGYAFAWAGHFLVEGNRPASFGYPLWSFYSDLRMLALWLTGRLEGELRRLGLFYD